MVDLMLHLRGTSAIEDVQEGDKKCAHDVLFDGALKYEHVIAVEGALDDSFEGAPTFEVSIND